MMKTAVLFLLAMSLCCCSRSMERRDRVWEQLVQPHRDEVDVGDVSLHYVDLGDGQPVVLIHGIADSTYSWHKNARALVEAGFRVIMVDQPGFGYSSIPDADWVYSVESQGEAILRLLDDLEIERFDLVGHSLGGAVSLYLTWKHPGRVRRLVVISPASERTSCPFGVMTDVVLALTGTRWFVGQALRSAFFDPEQVSDTMIDEYARLLDRPGRAGGGVLGGVCEGFFSPTFDQMTQSYGEVTQPVLIAWGEEDTWHPVDFGSDLNDRLPESQLDIVPNAGHNVHQEKAELINPTLVRFLRGAPEPQGNNMEKFSRITKTWEHRVAVPPEMVFPLLCPVRELEWIPNWRSEAVFLASGRAEDGGVFTTDFPDRGGRGVWVISRYEPPHAIGIVVFYADLFVERIDVTVAQDDVGGSLLRWTRTYTGLSDMGNRFLAETTGESLDGRMAHQLELLEHFCATGTMLRR